MKREEILNRARIAVGTRNMTYGEPEDNFEKIAALWSAYLDDEISAHDVALMMCLFKIARASSGLSADNYVDLCGYAACAAEVSGVEEWDGKRPVIPFDDDDYDTETSNIRSFPAAEKSVLITRMDELVDRVMEMIDQREDEDEEDPD